MVNDVREQAGPDEGTVEPARVGVANIDRDLGATTLRLLRDWDAWVHRRVETVSLEHPVSFLRRMSIDFTLPEDLPSLIRSGSGDPIYFVPLTLIKKGPLTRFNLVDEHGAVLPLLTRRRDGALAASVLTFLAESLVEQPVAAPGSELPPDIQQDLRDLVTLDSEDALPVIDRLRKGTPREGEPPENCVWRTWLSTTNEFIRVADLLADSFILTALVEGRPGTRRVIKFSYEEHGHPTQMALPPPLGFFARTWIKQLSGHEPSQRELTSLPLWLSRAVGWRPKAVKIDTPALARGGSYHLEVETPEGLKITRALLESRGPRKRLDSVESHLGRCHLYAKNRPDPCTGGAALINIRPEPSTIVRTAWIASAFATLVLVLVAARWRAITNGNVEAAMALLLLLPAGLAAYVARSREPAVLTEVLFGLRVVAASSALWLFLGAFVLVASRSCSGTAESTCSSWGGTSPAMWGLVLASLATFVVLLVAMTLIERPPEHGSVATTDVD